MKTLLTVAVVLITVGLALSACRPAGPAADQGGQPSWMPPDQQQQPQQGGPEGGQQGSEPAAAPPSIATIVAEWMEIGLTEEQIRSKIAEGIEIGALPQATAMQDGDKAMLEKAGATAELVEYLGTLELPDEITDPGPTPKEGAPPEGEAKEPEGDESLLVPQDQKKPEDEELRDREDEGAAAAPVPKAE